MLPFSDWKIKTVIYISSALLLALLLLEVFSLFGFDIPFIRPAIGFLFLTFVPGILILRVLKVRDISTVESLIFSVGLSIAFIYFIGLLANFGLPLLGSPRPISLIPLTALIIIFTLLLCILAIKRDIGTEHSAVKSSIGKYFEPVYLLLLLLPVLAILGALQVNYYQDNRIMLLAYGMIAFIMALFAFNKLPQDAYPFAIMMITLSTSLCLTLSSPAIYGHDSQLEIYFQDLVLQSGRWDPGIPNYINSCLSIVLFVPVYSLIMSVDSARVLLVVYPLIFSIMPLAIYQISRSQFGEKAALLAAFIFVAAPWLFDMVITNTRQYAALLFYSALLLLILDRGMARTKKLYLFIIFLFCLPVSLYSFSYIFIMYMALGLVLMAALSHPKVTSLWQAAIRRFNPPDFGTAVHQTADMARATVPGSLLTVIALLIAVTLAIAWNLYTSGGQGFTGFVLAAQRVYRGLGELIQPVITDQTALSALGQGFASLSILSKVGRIIQYFVQLFIVLGFLGLFLKPGRFNLEFIAFSIISMIMLLASVVVPYMATEVSLGRVYLYAMIMLGPLCAFGALLCVDWLAQFVRVASIKSVGLSVLTLFIFIPYFLYTSYFVFAFSRQPSSAALGPYRMDRDARVTQTEATAAAWLRDKPVSNFSIYGDASGRVLLSRYLYEKAGSIPISGETPDGSFIFLRTWNVRNNEMLMAMVSKQRRITTFIELNLMLLPKLTMRIDNSAAIYTNGNAFIFGPRKSP